MCLYIAKILRGSPSHAGTPSQCRPGQGLSGSIFTWLDFGRNLKEMTAAAQPIRTGRA